MAEAKVLNLTHPHIQTPHESIFRKGKRSINKMVMCHILSNLKYLSGEVDKAFKNQIDLISVAEEYRGY